MKTQKSNMKQLFSVPVIVDDVLQDFLQNLAFPPKQIENNNDYLTVFNTARYYDERCKNKNARFLNPYYLKRRDTIIILRNMSLDDLLSMRIVNVRMLVGFDRNNKFRRQIEFRPAKFSNYKVVYRLQIVESNNDFNDLPFIHFELDDNIARCDVYLVFVPEIQKSEL